MPSAPEHPDPLTETWVIVPAYNEEGVISGVLQDLIQYPFRIVVVDDGSSDRTAEVCLQFPVIVLRHLVNLGQGASLQTGLDFILASAGSGYIVTFDSDGQHHASDIAHLVEPLCTGHYDVALGSRFLAQGQAVNIASSRRLMLKMATVFTRLITGLSLTDTHNGLRAFTWDASRQIHISQNRMAHASEILNQIAGHHLRYCEVPVTITYSDYSRAKGQSIFNLVNILWELISEWIK